MLVSLSGFVSVGQGRRMALGKGQGGGVMKLGRPNGRKDWEEKLGPWLGKSVGWPGRNLHSGCGCTRRRVVRALPKGGVALGCLRGQYQPGCRPWTGR